MGPYTLSFGEVDGTRLPEVGGKGANLGELTRAGFPVPPGFCVTTAAYRGRKRTAATANHRDRRNMGETFCDAGPRRVLWADFTNPSQTGGPWDLGCAEAETGG